MWLIWYLNFILLLVMKPIRHPPESLSHGTVSPVCIQSRTRSKKTQKTRNARHRPVTRFQLAGWLAASKHQTAFGHGYEPVFTFLYVLFFLSSCMLGNLGFVLKRRWRFHRWQTKWRRRKRRWGRCRTVKGRNTDRRYAVPTGWIWDGCRGGR